MEPILEMIKTLTGINSPSGDTEEAIQFVEKNMQKTWVIKQH